MKKKLLILLLLTLLFTGCGQEMPEENPIVTMTFQDYGEIKIELYPNIAFNTVANFVNLVEDGFYNKNYINRVQKGFVVQAGAAKQLDYRIKGEFADNGVPNSLKHTKGVVSMARGENMDSANGQFFIMLGDAEYLDGKYAAFGKVIEGMDVVEKIEKADLVTVPGDAYSFLERESYITIEKATVDTKGYKYKVEKLKY